MVIQSLFMVSNKMKGDIRDEVCKLRTGMMDLGLQPHDLVRDAVLGKDITIVDYSKQGNNKLNTILNEFKKCYTEIENIDNHSDYDVMWMRYRIIDNYSHNMFIDSYITNIIDSSLEDLNDFVKKLMD